MRHVNILVRGRVQGVFFRSTARREAEKLGITGFVRNERDGSVYIEAEGDDEQLREFVAWCCKGPPLAKVEDCEVVEDGEIKHFQAFEIRYG